MKINILTKNIKLTPALKDFIEEKINTLEKFAKVPPLFPAQKINSSTGSQIKKYTDADSKIFNKKGAGPRVEAWIEIRKETLHHKKGPFFWAECQLNFPKKSIRSTAQRENLKLAINEVKDELQRELKEYKEKLTAKTKRGTRVLKKESKLFPLAPFYRKGRIREEGI
ncbi:MAG: ribosomal subunit interface protein [Parcubacteria group bacterium CG2_30_36_18]|uniref:Ribosomal subunit interface protein n=1 Tax=Candidatus Nealsonbacteria bacterium CG_4_9_14_0_8_um_filter_36_17 TaxID=1974693 RepID=A0A2M8DLK9_9BACT|nr:MAG: ribosomal subunit interface protein [Parcubacteria group bacterium CG2_30_36_18]PJB98705.1 MAG: ribosomal subunit interface protein [Candidatus Nealsonbacteria bacterium CG_4_9_14_0_8_um_filter_36_17]